MDNCIFCKIVKGELPTTKVYEDEKFFGLLSIEPIAYGHTLIIPKKHIPMMVDADDSEISEIFKISKKLMPAIKDAMGCDFVQLSVVGEEIPHFHVHLMPRYNDDAMPRWPTKKYKDSEEKDEVGKKISSLL